MWWPVQSNNYCKHCQRHVTFLVTTSKIFLVPYWHFLWTERPIHEIFTLNNSKGSSWCQLGDVSGSVLSDHCFTQTINMPCNSKSMSHWGLKIWCCPRQSGERCLIDRMASDFWIFINAVNLERNLNYSCNSGFRWPFSKPSGALGDEKCCMTRKKPRCDDLNSLTEVSFGRWCFYTGDKHVHDETVVARSSVCVCVQGFVDLGWHKDPCMMYHVKGTLMPNFDKCTFLQLFALIPQPGSEWPRLIVNINVKPVRRSKDEPVDDGWCNLVPM